MSRKDTPSTGNMVVINPKTVVPSINNSNNLSSSFSNHPDFEDVKDYYLTLRDAAAGARAVKEAGKRYLPPLTSQSEYGYQRYKDRAVYVNMTGKILNINASMVTRRTPTLTYSASMEEYFKADRPFFLTFKEVFSRSVKEVLLMNRVGLLVNIRDGKPVIDIVPTENMFNWVEDDDGKLIVAFVSEYEYTVDDETYSRSLVRYDFKHFINDNGVYSVIKYDSFGNPLTEEYQPSINGITLNRIPLIPITPNGVSFDTSLGIFYDIASINISHYNTSADLENARHFIGCPTPWITGATSESDLVVGSEKFLIIPPKDAEIGMLEFNGAGLSSLSGALAEKQSQMSQFSAQLMDTSSKGSEAEGTVRLRYSGESASLSEYTSSTEIGLRIAYDIVAEWLRTESPTIELNKDFMSTKLSSQEIIALTKAFVDGALTEEQLLYNLHRGEMLPEE